MAATVYVHHKNHPRPHIRYGTDGPRITGTDVWFEWMDAALTFIDQVRAILAVLEYPGGKELMGDDAFSRWCGKYVDEFVNPSPELTEVLRRNRRIK